MSGTDVGYATRLRFSYAMSGTEIGHAATRSSARRISANRGEDLLPSGTGPTVLGAPSAVPGTNLVCFCVASRGERGGARRGGQGEGRVWLGALRERGGAQLGSFLRTRCAMLAVLTC
eukprot:3941629-Rhodomonas_salina.2